MGMALVFVSLTCFAASNAWAAACEPQGHMFTSGAHIVTLEIRCFDPYLGTRLAFSGDSHPGKEICLVGNGESGACPDHFVGVVATVRLTVARARGTLRGKTSIREYVTVMAQSPDLPPRPPFEKTQALTSGAITDLEAFGYDEADIVEGQRDTVRKQARERLWRLCSQELYLNQEIVPFVTITWRYTLAAIEIQQVQAGLGYTRSDRPVDTSQAPLGEGARGFSGC
jgi:hypothetical protein